MDLLKLVQHKYIGGAGGNEQPLKKRINIVDCRNLYTVNFGDFLKSHVQSF